MTSPNLPTQFGRIPYAVIDAGVLAKLKPAATKVYLVIAAHADSNWRARVGMRRIARLAGIKLGSASRSVGQLVEAGLLKASKKGNGSPMHYLLIVPDRSSDGERLDCKSVHPTANGQKQRLSPRGAATVQSVAQNRSLVGEQNRGTKYEQQACAAAGDVRLALQAAGVRGKALEELAGLDGLTPVDVQAVYKRAVAKGASSPSGMLVSMLSDGERAGQADEANAKNAAWEALGAKVHAELLQAIIKADPKTYHMRGNIDTQRAMRKLARERGLLA